MLDEIGLFDEALGSYCEDVDLAWRAQLAGYRCRFVPTALVYHKLSATGSGPVASFFNARNRLAILAKDYPATLLRRHAVEIVKAQLAITCDAVRAWRGAAARATLRGQLAGLLNLPKMLRRRGATQRLKRVSDDYLESILS